MIIQSKSQAFSALLIEYAKFDVICMEVSKLIEEGYDIIEIRGEKFVYEGSLSGHQEEGTDSA